MNGDDNGDNGHWPREPIGRLDEPAPVELKAQRVAAMRSGPDEPILGLLEREMEFLLEHLEELRALHRDLDRDLLRSEARVKTDLLRLRPLRYSLNENHEPQRAALKRRGEDLARERRSLSLDLSTRRRGLLERLATLLERHIQVRGGGDNGGNGDGHRL
ncbi:MAG: hypothetical protein WD749_02825 [Phycisphaerales bacterium]